jgi:hypothetical protein
LIALVQAQQPEPQRQGAGPQSACGVDVTNPTETQCKRERLISMGELNTMLWAALPGSANKAERTRMQDDHFYLSGSDV